MAEVFRCLQEYWPARDRAHEGTEPACEEEPEPVHDIAGEEPVVASSQPKPGSEGASHVEETHDESQMVSEPTTPPSSRVCVEDDEYLAWTLGGTLKRTASPGSIWTSPKGLDDQSAHNSLEHQLFVLE